MSKRCDVCSKEPSVGHSVSRLGKRALVRLVKSRATRRWLPNLQPVKTQIDGRPRRIKACTSCIKKGKVQRRPTPAVSGRRPAPRATGPST